MLIRFLTIAFILMTSNCLAQDSSNNLNLRQKLILTREQNSHWFDSLNTLQLAQQVSFIIERVTLDTNVYVKHGMPDGIKINYDSLFKDKYAGCCKLLLIVSNPAITLSSDNYYKKPDYTEVIKLKQVLSKIKIDKIWIMKGSAASAIYGSEGENGVIFLNVTDKKSIDLIKSRYQSN